MDLLPACSNYRNVVFLRNYGFCRREREVELGSGLRPAGGVATAWQRARQVKALVSNGFCQICWTAGLGSPSFLTSLLRPQLEMEARVVIGLSLPPLQV